MQSKLVVKLLLLVLLGWGNPVFAAQENNESDWEYRYRGKFYLYLTGLDTDIITPLIYDEMFIKFNHTNWDSTETFQQNWLFLGADVEMTDTLFLEVGYMQQYVFDKIENRSNNILYVGFNFNPAQAPVYEYAR